MRVVRPILGVIALVTGLFVTFGTEGASSAPKPPRIKTQVVEVSTPTRADKARLQRLGLDLTEHGDADSLDVVLYNEAEAKKLRDNGFTYTVRVADLAVQDEANRLADEKYAAATTASALPSGRDSYRRLADYNAELAALAAQYPGLAKRITLNHPTWEGRMVQGIEITQNPNAVDGKPVFVMTGVHHAREWPSGEHTMEFAYDLLRNYGTDSRTTTLVNTVRTIIIPVVNPDGFNVSREARTGPPSQDFSAHDFEMKRKNCRDAVGTCNKKSRLIGVDPNRNYGGLWGGPGASTNPLDDTYRGPGPFSEPEIQNIRELVASRQVTMFITNHTYSNLVLRAPGTVDQGFPLDEPQQKALGALMASRNGYDNVPGFGLYDTTGGAEDWTFWSAGAFSYTFEIGTLGFHPPYETGVVAEYLGLAPAAGAGRGGNRAAFYDALSAATDASLHSTLTGSAPAGSRLSISKSFETYTSPVCQDDACTVVGAPQSFEDNLTASMVTTGSTFSWAVNPSTRPVVAGRDGRNAVAPAQASIPMVNSPQVVPAENIYYPGAAPAKVTPAYETFQFDVAGPPAVDNGRFAVHIGWANPANDWDVYVLDDAGKIVAQSASFGDADEDALLIDPPPGRYTAVIVNYDQVNKQIDDWTGEVRFTSPSPLTIGATESWTFTCQTPAGGTVTREVTVARGQSVDLGSACESPKIAARRR